MTALGLNLTIISFAWLTVMFQAISAEADKAKKKDEKKKLQDEINALFRPVAQTVSKGMTVYFMLKKKKY